VDFVEGMNVVEAVGYKEGETVKTNMEIHSGLNKEKKKDMSGRDSD
jgi:hypothetical protein